MASGTLALIILVIGLGTFLERLSFIHLSDRLVIPTILRRALHYVPAAVLAALVAPAVLRPSEAAAVPPENWRPVAALAAALLAWRTRNMLLTLAGGMACLWLLEWLF
ncbi:AzlD domain-containing protein [Thiohalorhabdus methylotrophus]|uniref:AzlD domain-containing protein n=1 Tax=Thiohalorhabdus methylotrophus TaxID=3242694 RepID=A0ABV4TQH0_9GAMM